MDIPITVSDLCFRGQSTQVAELLSHDEARRVAVGMNYPSAIAGGLIYLTKIKVLSTHQ